MTSRDFKEKFTPFLLVTLRHTFLNPPLNMTSQTSKPRSL